MADVWAGTDQVLQRSVESHTGVAHERAERRQYPRLLDDTARRQGVTDVKSEPEGRADGHAEVRRQGLAVADRGEGIPASDLPRVFTKFFRRAETRPTGSGLGLWISRGLIEAHGGQMARAARTHHATHIHCLAACRQASDGQHSGQCTHTKSHELPLLLIKREAILMTRQRRIPI